MGVTVAVVTRESASKLGGDLLRLVIHRACVELPASRILIIDAEGSDDTVNVIASEAGRHGVKATVLTDRLHSRAYARSLAIKAFSMLNDDLFMFLDDDAVLRRGWWSESIRLLASGCGAVWGINYDLYDGRVRLTKAFGMDYVEYLTHEYEVRGGTHDLLLTPKAVEALVKALPIPIELEYEDAYIHWVLKLSGIRECINQVGVIHLHRGMSSGYASVPVLVKSISRLIKPMDDFTGLMRRLEYEQFRVNSIKEPYLYAVAVKALAYLQLLPLP